MRARIGTRAAWPVAAAALLLSAAIFSKPAHADSYEFGSNLTGGGPAAADFASLSVAGEGTATWTFTLSVKDLTSYFGASAFVGAMAFNGVGSIPTPTISDISGPVTVGTSPGSGPGGSFDFWFTYGGGGNRLDGNETVSWTASFAQNVGTRRHPSYAPLSVQIGSPDFALHVQSISAGLGDDHEGEGGSGWYIPATFADPVPEPETYAMLLAGLGILGAIGRRRSRA